MAIDTDPSLYSYSTSPLVNPDVFGADQTPAQLICSIAGMAPGDLWSPGDDGAPNGLYLLPIFDADTYKDTFGNFDISFHIISTACVCEIRYKAGTSVFYGGAIGDSPCYCLSGYTAPAGRIYYNGACMCISPLDCEWCNMAAILKLINQNATGDPYYSQISVPPGQTCHHLYDPRGDSFCKILTETPLP